MARGSALGDMVFYLDYSRGHYSQLSYAHLRHTITKAGLLSLALTCREKYSETTNILDSTNEFCLRGSDAILGFRASLPAPRFESVRRVSFMWYWREPPLAGTPELAGWKKVWRELASMSRQLKTLRVELRASGEWQGEWLLCEERLLVSVQRMISS
ncbi:hypothetical protein LZ554_005255 [Drepanopeziza brunnea f. sp. 'monogermtubi']|nr:hypothetical protein LZ554_005255 [Drepanopeziza brunnea f. sp. 'monogermtubi']